eukprot:CAMPEP_0184316380 /NCGR_PEP_ID=MMETSP1049-20130417/89683_1 /TAXON_ID=77928 /ORGANISM="Proteomonas sulcata, Strain CCMP704" /LENGTH=67 /DNA_ID=CAMNT_0026635323 /DNA_START=108 /DNA_END=311 /DNA_ORIENTATION=+
MGLIRSSRVRHRFDPSPKVLEFGPSNRESSGTLEETKEESESAEVDEEPPKQPNWMNPKGRAQRKKR